MRLSPRCQDVIASCREALEDLDYLFGGLAGTEDDLRKATPDLPMMVYTRKTQVLERQVAKFLDRLVDIDLAVVNLLQ